MKTPVVIIGGGVMGLCTARALRQQGITSTILEMADVGNGSSLHNAGYMCPSHFVPLAAPGMFSQGLKWMFNPQSPLYIKPRLDFRFLSWVIKFARSCSKKNVERAMPVLRDLLLESQQMYEALAKEPGMNFNYTTRGLTVLFRSEKGKSYCAFEANEARRLGIEATMLNRTQLQEMDPAVEFNATGGLFFPGDAHMYPAAFVASLASHLESHGVAIQRNTQVLSFRAEGNRIKSIITNRGEIAGEEFVLAGGAWSNPLARDLGIRLHLEAGKGYSLTVENPPVNPRLPYIFNERRVAITPFADRLRFAGTMELAGINTTINMPRVEAILDAVPLYFKNVPRPTSTNGTLWGGMRPVTPDGMPYIGRFKQYPNLIAATGHAMIGMCLAPVTGRIVSEIIGNIRTERDLQLVDPNRFS